MYTIALCGEVLYDHNTTQHLVQCMLNNIVDFGIKENLVNRRICP